MIAVGDVLGQRAGDKFLKEFFGNVSWCHARKIRDFKSCEKRERRKRPVLALFFREGDLVKELLLVNDLDFHENAVRLVRALILPDSKWLSAL